MTRPFTHNPAPTACRAETPAGGTNKSTTPQYMEPTCRGQIDQMAEDERSQAERLLHAISTVCAAVVIAGLTTLLIVNLFPPLSPLGGYGLGARDLSSRLGAEATCFELLP